jgi:hypothetical protein
MAGAARSLPVDRPPLVRNYGIGTGSLLAGWKHPQNEALRDFEAILIEIEGCNVIITMSYKLSTACLPPFSACF